ncbi:MAG: type II toxin-antitoxin system VapC family toxin [Vulcanimicrobiaceae bacterium]
MPVFLDTSGFFALLDADDLNAPKAVSAWRSYRERDAVFLTHTYVVVESTALVQRRLGMKVAENLREILGQIDVHVVDRSLHDAAMAAFFQAGRRGLSLVDCASFEFMRRRGISEALAFDADFSEQGFTLP